jgi:hypothetical protein
MSDWYEWHAAYDQEGSALQERLELVVGHVARAVSARPPGPIRLISMCAGQGHDVAGALREHPRRADVTGRLVENDPANAAVARGTGLDVLEADAGRCAAYEGAVPAGVVLVCGVFGNISDADIRGTVEALPELCAPGARVIWTRHRREPDRTPDIRRWFAGAGFRELAFDAPAERELGVGVHELTAPPRPFDPGRRLFTFDGRPHSLGRRT